MRDELWGLACQKCKGGSVLQMWSSNVPQGYAFRAFGPNVRQMRDCEGIALVCRSEEPKGAPRLRAVVPGKEREDDGDVSESAPPSGTSEDS